MSWAEGLNDSFMYILVPAERIHELPSQTVADPLEICLIGLVVILPRAWHLTGLFDIDQPLLLIMREAVPSSFLNRIIKNT